MQDKKNNIVYNSVRRALFPVKSWPVISVFLQSIVEELIHLCDTRRDTKVNGAITNFNDQSANDIRVDLVRNLELLALADILGFRNGGFKTRKHLIVEGLEKKN